MYGFEGAASAWGIRKVAPAVCGVRGNGSMTVKKLIGGQHSSATVPGMAEVHRGYGMCEELRNHRSGGEVGEIKAGFVVVSRAVVGRSARFWVCRNDSVYES